MTSTLSAYTLRGTKTLSRLQWVKVQPDRARCVHVHWTLPTISLQPGHMLTLKYTCNCLQGLRQLLAGKYGMYPSCCSRLTIRIAAGQHADGGVPVGRAEEGAAVAVPHTALLHPVQRRPAGCSARNSSSHMCCMVINASPIVCQVSMQERELL